MLPQICAQQSALIVLELGQQMFRPNKQMRPSKCQNVEKSIRGNITFCGIWSGNTSRGNRFTIEDTLTISCRLASSPLLNCVVKEFGAFELAPAAAKANSLR